MAIRIPTIDAPQVSSTAMPTPFQSTSVPDAGGLASLGAQALDAGSKFALKSKSEADAQRVQEAHLQFNALVDAGVERIKRAEGTNAQAEALKVYADLDKQSKRIFAGLSNNEQQLTFTGLANQSLNQLQKIGESHVGEQMKVADIADFNALNPKGLDRSGNNIHVQGVAEEEAMNADRRIFGYDENGVRVPGFAERRGMTKDSAESLRNKLTAQLYADKATRLMNLGELQAAESVVTAHSQELGEAGKEIVGHIAEKARMARASAKATEFSTSKDFMLGDGNIDTLKAESWIVKNVAEGPERVAYKAALDHEAEFVKKGIDAQHKATWDALLGDYQQMGRSFWQTVKNSPAWSKATSQERENLYQRWMSDTREKEGMPMTPLQMRAYGELTADLHSRTDYWGTADFSELDRDRRFNVLPERVQKQVTDTFANLHTERGNVNTLYAPVEKIILERSQSPGHPLDGTAGKKITEWDPDEIDNWVQIQDGVKSRIAAWRQENQKAPYVPAAVAQGFVDDITREFRVKEDRWLPYLTIGTRNVRLSDTVGKQVLNPVPFEDEEKLGKEVLRRQGWKPEEITPEKILEAAGAARTVQSYVPPQDRERIRKILLRSSKGSSDAAVRKYWEAEQLHYQQD